MGGVEEHGVAALALERGRQCSSRSGAIRGHERGHGLRVDERHVSECDYPSVDLPVDELSEAGADRWRLSARVVQVLDEERVDIGEGVWT